MTDSTLPQDGKRTPVPSIEAVPGGFRTRLRYGKGLRDRFLIRIADETEAAKRAAAMQELANVLARSGHSDMAPAMLARAGEADARGFRDLVRVAEGLAAGKLKRAPKAKGSAMTFQAVGDDWTSGELHRRFPDYVKAKTTSDDDASRLARLYDKIGDIPLASFTEEHAELAMSNLPAKLSSASRRHYAQTIAKVLRLAVYPLRIIERSPLPEGFLPKVKSKQAKSYLYPNEEAQLLGCLEVPLARRILYGFLAREGCRVSEALGLTWENVDLDHGTVTLDRNKTATPRVWALSPDVVIALELYRTDDSTGLIFPGIEYSRQAERFRDDLKEAGINRPELTAKSDVRLPIRVHDLRGTFVTLALANGRSETWVSDRTGHTSSVMINRYKRQARTAQELGLGSLAPMDQTIPELRDRAVQGVGQKVGQKLTPENIKGPSPKAETLVFSECRRWDSNPHEGLPRRILNPLRLPFRHFG